MSIEIRQIRKTFGASAAVRDIDLKIETGELVALLGPSGSGKTTLLRLIAGLEAADSGTILFDDQAVTGASVRDRRVGFVFQHYALFRHMTVYDNIAFGLKVRPRKSRPSKQQIRERVRDLLALVQLEGLESRYPSQLSGGQRQRVALARALAIEPQVLLLDEPFGALDAKVRQELRRWLRQLHDNLHITSVFVTHDQEEALEVADRVVVMNNGRIEQVGTPDEVYHRPANPFVYSFLGRVNVFRGGEWEGRAGIAPAETAATGSPAVGYIRPHELELFAAPVHPSAIEATIARMYRLGPVVRLELKRRDNAELVEAEISDERYRQLNLQPGDTVFVSLQKIRLFAEKADNEDNGQDVVPLAIQPANPGIQIS